MIQRQKLSLMNLTLLCLFLILALQEGVRGATTCAYTNGDFQVLPVEGGACTGACQPGECASYDGHDTDLQCKTIGGNIVAANATNVASMIFVFSSTFYFPDTTKQYCVDNTVPATPVCPVGLVAANSCGTCAAKQVRVVDYGNKTASCVDYASSTNCHTKIYMLNGELTCFSDPTPLTLTEFAPLGREVRIYSATDTLVLTYYTPDETTNCPDRSRLDSSYCFSCDEDPSNGIIPRKTASSFSCAKNACGTHGIAVTNGFAALGNGVVDCATDCTNGIALTSTDSIITGTMVTFGSVAASLNLIEDKFCVTESCTGGEIFDLATGTCITDAACAAKRSFKETIGTGEFCVSSCTQTGNIISFTKSAGETSLNYTGTTALTCVPSTNFTTGSLLKYAWNPSRAKYNGTDIETANDVYIGADNCSTLMGASIYDLASGTLNYCVTSDGCQAAGSGSTNNKIAGTLCITGNCPSGGDIIYVDVHTTFSCGTCPTDKFKINVTDFNASTLTYKGANITNETELICLSQATSCPSNTIFEQGTPKNCITKAACQAKSDASNNYKNLDGECVTTCGADKFVNFATANATSTDLLECADTCASSKPVISGTLLTTNTNYVYTSQRSLTDNDKFCLTDATTASDCQNNSSMANLSTYLAKDDAANKICIPAADCLGMIGDKILVAKDGLCTVDCTTILSYTNRTTPLTCVTDCDVGTKRVVKPTTANQTFEVDLNGAAIDLSSSSQYVCMTLASCPSHLLELDSTDGTAKKLCVTHDECDVNVRASPADFYVAARLYKRNITASGPDTCTTDCPVNFEAKIIKTGGTSSNTFRVECTENCAASVEGTAGGPTPFETYYFAINEVPASVNTKYPGLAAFASDPDTDNFCTVTSNLLCPAFAYSSTAVSEGGVFECATVADCRTNIYPGDMTTAKIASIPTELSTPFADTNKFCIDAANCPNFFQKQAAGGDLLFECAETCSGGDKKYINMVDDIVEAAGGFDYNVFKFGDTNAPGGAVTGKTPKLDKNFCFSGACPTNYLIFKDSTGALECVTEAGCKAKGIVGGETQINFKKATYSGVDYCLQTCSDTGHITGVTDANRLTFATLYDGDTIQTCVANCGANFEVSGLTAVAESALTAPTNAIYETEKYCIEEAKCTASTKATSTSILNLTSNKCLSELECTSSGAVGIPNASYNKVCYDDCVKVPQESSKSAVKSAKAGQNGILVCIFNPNFYRSAAHLSTYSAGNVDLDLSNDNSLYSIDSCPSTTYQFESANYNGKECLTDSECLAKGTAGKMGKNEDGTCVVDCTSGYYSLTLGTNTTTIVTCVLTPSEDKTNLELSAGDLSDIEGAKATYANYTGATTILTNNITAYNNETNKAIVDKSLIKLCPPIPAAGGDPDTKRYLLNAVGKKYFTCSTPTECSAGFGVNANAFANASNECVSGCTGSNFAYISSTDGAKADIFNEFELPICKELETNVTGVLVNFTNPNGSSRTEISTTKQWRTVLITANNWILQNNSPGDVTCATPKIKATGFSTVMLTSANLTTCVTVDECYSLTNGSTIYGLNAASDACVSSCTGTNEKFHLTNPSSGKYTASCSDSSTYIYKFNPSELTQKISITNSVFLTLGVNSTQDLNTNQTICTNFVLTGTAAVCLPLNRLEVDTNKYDCLDDAGCIAAGKANTNKIYKKEPNTSNIDGADVSHHFCVETCNNGSNNKCAKIDDTNKAQIYTCSDYSEKVFQGDQTYTNYQFYQDGTLVKDADKYCENRSYCPGLEIAHAPSDTTSHKMCMDFETCHSNFDYSGTGNIGKVLKNITNPDDPQNICIDNCYSALNAGGKKYLTAVFTAGDSYLECKEITSPAGRFFYTDSTHQASVPFGPGTLTLSQTERYDLPNTVECTNGFVFNTAAPDTCFSETACLNTNKNDEFGGTSVYPTAGITIINKLKDTGDNTVAYEKLCNSTTGYLQIDATQKYADEYWCANEANMYLDLAQPTKCLSTCEEKHKQGTYCVTNRDNCVDFNKLKGTNDECVDSCQGGELVEMNQYGQGVKCVTTCQGSFTQADDTCRPSANIMLGEDKYIDAAGAIQTKATCLAAGKVIEMQNLADATTRAHCISKATCMSRGATYFIKDNECVNNCYLYGFVKLDKDITDDNQLERYCEYGALNTLGLTFTYKDTGYYIHSTSNVDGFYAKVLTELAADSAQTMKYRVYRGDIDSDCPEPFMKYKPTGKIPSCNTKFGCTSTLNTEGAAMFWKGFNCYKSLDDVTGDNRFKFYTPSKETVSYEQCIKRGMIISEDGKCIPKADCATATFMLRTSSTSSTALLKNETITICTTNALSGVNKSSLTSFVTNTLGYSDYDGTKILCYKEGANYHLIEDNPNYYYSGFAKKTGALAGAPGICGTTAHYISFADCKTAGAIVSFSSLTATPVCETTPSSTSLASNGITAFDGSYTEDTCNNQGGVIVYTKNGANIVGSCHFTAASVTALTGHSNFNGIYYDDAICDVTTFAAATYYFTRVSPTKLVCNVKATGFTGLLVPNVDTGIVKGFVVTETRVACNLHVKHAWREVSTGVHVCQPFSECKSAGNFVFKEGTSDKFYYKCGACPGGMFRDIEEGVCYEACQVDTVADYAGTTINKCEQITTAASAGANQLELLKSHADQYVNYDCTTKILGYSIVDFTKKYFCAAEADCATIDANNTILEYNSVKYCIPKTECMKIGDRWGIDSNGACKEALTAEYTTVVGNRMIYDAPGCNTAGLLVLNDTPNQCISKDECLIRKKRPSNGECASTCSNNYMSVKNSHGEFGFECADNCSSNHFPLIASAGFTGPDPQCHTAESCSALGFFHYQDGTENQCYETRTEARAAFPNAVCNPDTHKCSPAYSTATCPNKPVLIQLLNVCVDLDGSIRASQAEDSFLSDATPNKVLTFAECKTSHTKINFATKTCSSTTLGDCPTGFVTVTIDSIEYCTTKEYCTSPSFMDFFWDGKNSTCSKDCSSKLKFGTGSEKECLTMNECNMKGHFINAVKGAASYTMDTCVTTCTGGNKIFSKLEYDATDGAINKLICFDQCDFDYVDFSSGCALKTDCVMDGTTCAVLLSNPGTYKYSYDNTTSIATANQCNTTTSIRFRTKTPANVPSVCYTAAECTAAGGVVAIDISTIGSSSYFCDFVCDKRFEFTHAGIKYCLDSCDNSIKLPTSDTFPELKLNLKIESDYQYSCEVQTDCNATNFFNLNGRCAAKVLSTSSAYNSMTLTTRDTLESGTNTDSEILLGDCHCDKFTCPNGKMKGTDGKCFNYTYCLSLTTHIVAFDNGELICRKRTTEEASLTGLAATKPECNSLNGETVQRYFFSNGNEQQCLTLSQCIAKEGYSTSDFRCLTKAQCQADTSLYFLIGNPSTSDGSKCVTRDECVTETNDNGNLMPTEADFILSGDTRMCFKCKNTEYYLPPSLATGYKYDMCLDDCPTALYHNNLSGIPFTCLNKCPAFSLETATGVTKKFCATECPSNFFRINSSPHNTCLLDKLCPTGTFHINVSNAFTYNNSNTCVSSCPTGYRQVGQTCIVCDDYMFNNKCYSTCPEYTKTNEANKTCSTCKQETADSVFYQDRCVLRSEMNFDKVIKVSDEFEAYKDCGWDNNSGIDPVDEKCYAKCPSTNGSKGIINGFCQECKPIIKGTNDYSCRIKEGKYLIGTTCGGGYTLHTTKGFLCVTNEDFANLEKPACPTGQQRNPLNSACEPCRNFANNFFLESEGDCVVNCPPKFTENTTTKNCDACALVQGEICVDRCSRGLMPQNGVCTDCATVLATSRFVASNGSCKAYCAEGQTPESNNCVAEPTTSNNGDACTGCIDCGNNGTSVFSIGGAICKCNDGFVGTNCEFTENQAESEADSINQSLNTTYQELIVQNLQTNFARNSTIVQVKQKTTNIFKLYSPQFGSTQARVNIINQRVSRVTKLAKDSTEFLRKQVNLTNTTAVTHYINEMSKVEQIINNLYDNLHLTFSIAGAEGRRMLQSTAKLDISRYYETRQSIKDKVDGYIIKPSLNTTPEHEKHQYYTISYTPFSSDSALMETVNTYNTTNNLPSVDLTKCLEGKSSDAPFVVATIEWQPLQPKDNKTHMVEYLVYSYASKQQVDCKGFDAIIKINANNVNTLTPHKDKAVSLLDKELDLFNHNTDLYTKRCFSYQEEGRDFNLKMRKEILYPKVNPLCSSDCTYIGVTKEFFIRCNCINKAEVEVNTQPLTLSGVPTEPVLSMFECNAGISNDEASIGSNWAFWLFLIALLLLVVGVIIFLVIKKVENMIEHNHDKVVQETKYSTPVGKPEKSATHGQAGDKEGQQTETSQAQTDGRVYLERAPAGDALSSDETAFGEYYWYMCRRNVLFLSPFFNYSLLKNSYIRLVELFLLICCALFFNAFYFYDSAVENNYTAEGESAPADFFKAFRGWSGAFERIIWSVLSLIASRVVLGWLVYVPTRTVETLSTYLGDSGNAKEGYANFKKENLIQYIIYGVIALALFIFTGYYSLALNDFYPNIGVDWLGASVITLIIYWIVQFALLALHCAIKGSGSSFLYAASRLLTN